MRTPPTLKALDGSPAERQYYFHDEGALLERLGRGLRKRNQEVVFLVGAPLSAPFDRSVAGVAGVEGVIQLIREEFSDDPMQLQLFEQSIAATGENRYQQAFLFLHGRRGQPTANEIIREAVLKGRTGGSRTIQGQGNPDNACRALEADLPNWALAPGMKALGQLVAAYPAEFGRSLLTTNFDPLIEVSIRRAGGSYFRFFAVSRG
jgi:hypothetical protein